MADLPPLQVQEDPHDGGGGLAPGAGLLPAPGDADLTPLPLPSPDTVQCFVFRVRSHPLYPEYKQCTTIGTFQTPEKVMLVWTAVLTLYFEQ